jgi:predicted DsbA family dithiol-disulfide isomerase
MTTPIHIDFVSDVSCPWCAIGLWSLETALARLGNEVAVSITFQPFELNPHMEPGGQDIAEHLTQKYGSTPAQQAQIRATLRERGAAVGFDFHPDGRGRVYNTFNAHRLLHWAATLDEAQGSRHQLALKKALMTACHTHQQAMDQAEVLLNAAVQAGLPADAAREVLDSEAHASGVRHAQMIYRNAGIQAVPAVVLDRQYLISGGQPAEVYEQALRSLVQEKSGAAPQSPEGA